MELLDGRDDTEIKVLDCNGTLNLLKCLANIFA